MANKGRPTKFQADHTVLAARALAELGQTDRQICKALEITEATLTNWKKDFPDFFASLKDAKTKADNRVEKSLFKNAVGFSYKTQKPMVVSDGNGEGSHVEIVEVTERQMPQTTAQIFWLKNRRPDLWRDRQEVAHSGEITEHVDADSRESRSAKWAEILKKAGDGSGGK